MGRTMFSFSPLHATFAAEVTSIDLRDVVLFEELEKIRHGMDEFAVLIFRNQSLSVMEQVAFAQRLDGELHDKTSNAVLTKNRYGHEAVTDISNVDAGGDILDVNDRRRMNGIANRIWHTDASFQDPPGRYSMLYARALPPVRADTQFADMRAAYTALDASSKEKINGLHAHHSIVYSRHIMGFDFSEEEQLKLPGASHPLVRHFPNTNSRSLYLASHAQYILEMAVPEGRLLLRDLMEHATQHEFVFSHEWQLNDLVIWDNRTTMHRASSFDDKLYKRELTRVTTLDLPLGS